MRIQKADWRREFGHPEDTKPSDFREGELYRSRFGFLVKVERGVIYRERPNGEWVEIHPADVAVFRRQESSRKAPNKIRQLTAIGNDWLKRGQRNHE